jgi:hypothetical protein
MELKEFITATMSAIVDATSELQTRYENDGILINPPSSQSGTPVFQPDSAHYALRRVQNVSFDVAVTASSSISGGGSGGIKVFSAELGAKTEGAKSDERVSRVQFQIPLTLKPSCHEKTNGALSNTSFIPVS